jgi:hypothetical protein
LTPKVLSLEESRLKRLGLPVPLIEGDYEEELEAPREPSQSSESASASERDQAIVGNVTQAPRDATPEKAAKSPPARNDTSKLP